jgi:SAM-dependent methyltransferase
VKRLRSLAKRVLGYGKPDYREYLFHDLVAYLGGRTPRRILEIGPKDGQDSARLMTLGPERLVLIDLPAMAGRSLTWLPTLDASRVEYISANVMYSPEVDRLEPFDCVWCTGVLYHNPEQLRMIRRLYDKLVPGGVLALESATARARGLRDANCVQIVYPPSPALKRKYHISANVTHLPSARAIESWLAMVGFERIAPSVCHRKVSRPLARSRAAYLATKPVGGDAGRYYTISEDEGFVIGRAL